MMTVMKKLIAIFSKEKSLKENQAQIQKLIKNLGKRL